MSVETRRILGIRIRTSRKNRLNNIPLEEFGRQIAQMMGRPRPFSNVTVSNWETGRQEPSWEALVSIARISRLPLRFFAGVGEIEDYPMSHWVDSDAIVVDERFRTLINAVQRLEYDQQRLAIRQMEVLVVGLREEEPAISYGR